MGEQITQKKFNIKRGKNGVTIEVSSQTYFKVYDEKGILILYDRSKTNQINTILKPGHYAIETDGKIKSVKSTISKKGDQQLE